jgi:hypothetical protein
MALADLVKAPAADTPQSDTCLRSERDAELTCANSPRQRPPLTAQAPPRRRGSAAWAEVAASALSGVSGPLPRAPASRGSLFRPQQGSTQGLERALWERMLLTAFRRHRRGYGRDLKPERGGQVKVLATLAVMGLLAVGSLVMSASAGAAAFCHGFPATMTGSSGSDHIVGTNHRDIIVARGGGDEIRGRGGRDLICAGRGDDDVAAGARRDRVYAGAGHDELGGGAADDRLFGERGRDELLGWRGSDLLNGGSEVDEGFGGSGADTCLSIEFAHSC